MNRAFWAIVAGAILTVGGILLGFIVTLFGMVRTFDSVAASGSPPPGQVADGIRLALVSTFIGIGISLIGVSLVVGGLIAHFVGRRSEKPP